MTQLQYSRSIVVFLSTLAFASTQLSAQSAVIDHGCVRLQKGTNVWVEYTVTSLGDTCEYRYRITNNDRLPGEDKVLCTADDTFPMPPKGIAKGVRIFGLKAHAPLDQLLTTNWTFGGTSPDPPDDPGPAVPPAGTTTHWQTLCDTLAQIQNGGTEEFVLTSNFRPTFDKWYLRSCNGNIIESIPTESLAVPGPNPKNIPTLSSFGLVVLSLVLLVIATLTLRHR